ncbi:DUF1804 family protein [Roseospirillum parvum]|uniref:DUF1804 family protein n=1 Tax=Roseospirillum parvum TaxID=83401 RepID=A0A1G8EY66_9PROT|nr:DUF1804 family protein [Roseospirillum parvum]SDH74836.1 Protein of unknown function [Roseospirillum parvum]
MAHPPETRAAARAAYVFERLPLDAVAARLELGAATVRRWKAQDAATGDDWDKARAATALSREGAGTIAQLVLTDFLAMYQATVEGLREDADISPMARAEGLSRLADAFTKTMNAVAKASPELHRFAVANELLRDLAGFVRRDFPEHVDALLEILEPFAADVARRYG